MKLDEGYTLRKIENNRLFLTCPRGHEISILKDRWINHHARCLICKEEDYFKQLQEELFQENYILNKIIHAPIRLDVTCPNKHSYSVLLNNWRAGYRCRECQRTNWTYEKVQNLFQAEGYKLLSTEYLNNSQSLNFICPNKHYHSISLSAWLRGIRCGQCHKKQEELTQDFSKYDLTLLTCLTKHSDIISLECSKCKYIWNIRFYDWKNTQRTCPKCRGQIKYTIEDVRATLSKENYTLLSTEYKGSHSELIATCPNGHQYSFLYTNFLQGYRCGSCSSSTSKAEQEILDIYKVFNPQKTRKLIAPKEIDIYFEEQKLAIEYCGLYWHSNQQERITPQYHYQKWKACKEKNVHLITIFEDEWLKHKEICLSRINNSLAIEQVRVHARKCTVKEIVKHEAQEFLNANHLQGCGTILVAYGLYFEDQLIQVMTGGLPNREHTKNGKRVIELKRLASKLNYQVTGGASKLLKHLLAYAKTNNFEQIKSYCDVRWGTGKLYEKLGFTLMGSTHYTPHYIQNGKRVRNITVQKKDEKDYAIIYDCGHQTWILDL